MTRVPRRLVGDLSHVQVSTEDRHLLSFVDSTLDERDLAFVTGKPLDALSAALDRLALLGLVDFGGRKRSAPPAAAPTAAEWPGGPADSSGHDRPTPWPEDTCTLKTWMRFSRRGYGVFLNCVASSSDCSIHGKAGYGLFLGSCLWLC